MSRSGGRVVVERLVARGGEAMGVLREPLREPGPAPGIDDDTAASRDLLDGPALGVMLRGYSAAFGEKHRHIAPRAPPPARRRGRRHRQPVTADLELARAARALCARSACPSYAASTAPNSDASAPRRSEASATAPSVSRSARRRHHLDETVPTMASATLAGGGGPAARAAAARSRSYTIRLKASDRTSGLKSMQV
jgi:hypothetical protein